MAEPDRRSRHACARIKFGSSTVGLSAWHRLGVRESPPTWLGIKTWDAYVPVREGGSFTPALTVKTVLSNLFLGVPRRSS